MLQKISLPGTLGAPRTSAARRRFRLADDAGLVPGAPGGDVPEIM